MGTCSQNLCYIVCNACGQSGAGYRTGCRSDIVVAVIAATELHAKTALNHSYDLQVALGLQPHTAVNILSTHPAQLHPVRCYT